MVSEQKPAAEVPVFLDESGRRNRILRSLGVALAALMALWVAAIAATVAGLGTLPGVPLLRGGGAHRAPRVNETAPKPQRPGPASHPLHANRHILSRGAARSTAVPRRAPAANGRAPAARRSVTRPPSRTPASQSAPRTTLNGIGADPVQRRPMGPRFDPSTRSQSHSPARTNRPATTTTGSTAPGRSNPHKPSY